jgi:hypothetical protein
MKMNDLEQRVINALHQEHPAQTLRAWVGGGGGMPPPLLEELVGRLQPDDDTTLQLVLQSERPLARTPAPARFWAERPQEAIPRTTILELARVQVASHVQQHVRSYERALRLVLGPDLALSPDSLALLGLFLREYLRQGYLHAGHVSPGPATIQLAWEELDQFWTALEELVAASLVQHRGCQIIAYELTYPARSLLIAHFALRVAWFEANPLFQADQSEEVERVEQAMASLAAPDARENER